MSQHGDKCDCKGCQELAWRLRFQEPPPKPKPNDKEERWDREDD